MGITGRFAPSPSGPLHGGSLVAAMASWLDVRARGGRWLVRIEDIDRPRTVPGAAERILAALDAHGFRWDGPVVYQSNRLALYDAAFERLRVAGHVYGCACSRREVEEALDTVASVGGAAPYPGTCRDGLAAGRQPRAWRMRVPATPIVLRDRAAGTVCQNLATEVGDFVVRRADGLWAYQLAVVADDAAQGVTDIVRGADLLDSTPRQWWLREALGLPQPTTLHVPLLLAADGTKLAKSSGAAPLDPADPLPALRAAARHLSLGALRATSVNAFWVAATAAWAARWCAE